MTIKESSNKTTNDATAHSDLVSNNNNVTRQDKSHFPGKCIADTTFQAERLQKRVFTAATISTTCLWRGSC